MNQIHLFNLTSSVLLPLTNLVFFSFFFLAGKASAVDENFTICSVPRYCGRVAIRFPFFIQELEESRCGYPGFNISCRNKIDPILSLPDGDYIIHDIFYKTQSFHVSKAVSWNEDSVCSQPISNISIPEGQFYLPKYQREIVLLFNCNLTLPYTWRFSQYKVACSAENQTNATLALFKDDPILNNASTYCNKAMVVPVDFSQGEGGVESMLNRGFLLNWTASNCSICEDSGGKCGFDYGTYHFKCFCPDRPHAWYCPPGDSSGFAIKMAAASSGCAVILVLLIIIAVCLKRKMMKTEEDKKIEAFLKDHQLLAPKRYTYSNIKHITNSFRDRLGKGGFGDVYKGKLKDGRHVAVKILNKSKAKGEDFINEVASISRTSHVNIVTLLGFCFEGSRRALIYEFVSNGSLEKFIFQRDAYDGQLNWETLYRIAVGIARGLEYLHRGCATPILHFDIKPHNILLNNDFCPKISDFGLAKLCKEKESVISMTGARGTVGYIAPEVFSRNFGKASHKSDVYSYGMMVLEMIGGRKNINVQVDRTSEIYFPDWIYNHIELDGLGLQGVIDEIDRERVKKMAVSSLWCIQINPSDRPTMSRVVEMMEGTIDSLKIPPKPVLSSPTASPATSNSSTTPLS